MRCACVLVYRIRPGASSPQALLLAAVLMQLVALMLCLQLPALLPQYASFGAQTIASGGGAAEPCTLQHAAAAGAGGAVAHCRVTYMVRLARRVFAGIPSLALLFEVVNWAFVGVAVGWAARAFCLRAERRRERGGGDHDEERGLLDG